MYGKRMNQFINLISPNPNLSSDQIFQKRLHIAMPGIFILLSFLPETVSF